MTASEATTRCQSTEDDCEDVARTAGLCWKHYQRQLRRSKGAKPRRAYTPGATCEVEGCDGPIKAKGLCNPHYMRARRGSDDPKGPVTSLVRPCSFEGCDAPVHGNDLCGGHYYQQRHGQELRPLRRHAPNEGPCAVEDCGRDATNADLCPTHYQRRLRGETDWDRPIKAKAANGAGHINADGYVLVYQDGRKGLQHRLLMEDLLGRPLLPTETVHHVNGVRHENWTDGPPAMDDRGRLRSGNLELWSHAQPAGQEIGPKIEFARSILALYGTQAEQVTYAEFSPLTQT